MLCTALNFQNVCKCLLTVQLSYRCQNLRLCLCRWAADGYNALQTSHADRTHKAMAPHRRLHVRTQTCCARAQYYFETIFPRIPKPVQDDFVSKLTSMGLPSRAVGNAGQGGADRRGIEEANRRPASVKASLCGLQALSTALQAFVLDASCKFACKRHFTGCLLACRTATSWVSQAGT